MSTSYIINQGNGLSNRSVFDFCYQNRRLLKLVANFGNNYSMKIRTIIIEISYHAMMSKSIVLLFPKFKKTQRLFKFKYLRSIIMKYPLENFQLFFMVSFHHYYSFVCFNYPSCTFINNISSRSTPIHTQACD